MKPRFILLWSILCWSSLSLAQSDREATSGSELAAQIRDSVPPEPSEIKGTLILKKNRQADSIPVICKVVLEDNQWRTVYETAPTNRHLVETFIVIHHPGSNNEYLYARAADGAPRKISGPQLDVPFAGSDFWLSDLGLDFLHWPEQKKLPGQMRLGKPCYVLESKSDGQREAVRVKTWVEKESNGILVAEAYDSHQQLIKEFSLSGKSFRKVNGRWQLEKMEIRSPRAGSSTVLKFNVADE